jgi:hypothetical protein
LTYDGIGFFGAGVQDLLVCQCCSLHDGGGGVRHMPERRPPWVVVKMTCGDNDLLGGGWLDMVFYIGGGLPSSTLSTMVQGSHSEPQWRACAVGCKLVNPCPWEGRDPSTERKLCPTFTGVSNVDTFRWRSLVEGDISWSFWGSPWKSSRDVL